MFERFKREPEGSAGRTTTEPGATAANGRTAVAERPAEAETTATERDRGQTRTRDEREAYRVDREATRRRAPAGRAATATGCSRRARRSTWPSASSAAISPPRTSW